MNMCWNVNNKTVLCGFSRFSLYLTLKSARLSDSRRRQSRKGRHRTSTELQVSCLTKRISFPSPFLLSARFASSDLKLNASMRNFHSSGVEHVLKKFGASVQLSFCWAIFRRQKRTLAELCAFSASVQLPSYLSNLLRRAPRIYSLYRKPRCLILHMGQQPNHQTSLAYLT